MANPRETTISYSEVDTMNVVWKYLDKRAGAVAALKDFSSMKFIIEHTDDEIKEAYDKMSSVGGVRYDGMPHTRNLHATEDRIIKGIEEIDVLKERYRQAAEYMAWFVPAGRNCRRTSGTCWKPSTVRTTSTARTPSTTSATISISSVPLPTTRRTVR